jgi:hypothetical protein
MAMCQATEGTEMRSRAQKGGEIGTNGEFYEGGKFLPSTTNPKKHTKSVKGSGRQQIEPYVWAEAPEGMRSIYGTYAGVWGHKAGGTVEVPARLWGAVDYWTVDYLNTATEMAAAYNAGERWFKREAA